MKKNYLFLSVAFAKTVIIVATFILFTEGSNVQSDTKSMQTSSIPDDLHKVFEKSCMGCHAKGGNMMAMSHLNFSKWDGYSSQKMATIAADMCKMLSKGAMPPKSARQSHPETIPTDDQIKSICMWSESLNKNIKK